MKKYIKMEDMKDGWLYRIDARNAVVGVWVEESKWFVISRHKFGQNFIHVEDHYDTGSPYGTAKPIYRIEKCCTEPNLDYLNKWTNAMNPIIKYIGRLVKLVL